MRKGNLLRRIIKLVGLVLLTAGLILVLELSSRSSPLGGGQDTAYPRPGQENMAATTTLAGSPYPARASSATPALASTFTPGSGFFLPPAASYTVPGPFKEMWLLYSDSNSPGYTIVRMDGTGKIRWPDWPDREAKGVMTDLIRVSPAGGKILYTLHNDLDWDIASVWTMDMDGNHKQRLATAENGKYPGSAIWSPDGKQIAYYLETDNGNHVLNPQEIWVMDADGRQARLLSQDPLIRAGGGIEFVFKWMPNGYIYIGLHTHTLYGLDSKTGMLYQLLDNIDPLNISSYLSPDGVHIFPSASLSEDQITKAGFLSVKFPTGSAMAAGFLGWSEDGSRLSYKVLSPTDQAGIWIHDLKGSWDEYLIPNVEAYGGGFSPDNHYYAFQTQTGLFIADVETKKLQMVEKDLHDPLIPTENAISFLAWIPVQ